MIPSIRERQSLMNNKMSLESIRNSVAEAKKTASKFISLGDGQSFTGRYVDVKEVEDSKFGTQISFSFVVSGEAKTFNRSRMSRPTMKLLDDMLALGITAGDTVKITRTGLAKETSFKVKKINATNETIETDDSEPSGSADPLF